MSDATSDASPDEASMLLGGQQTIPWNPVFTNDFKEKEVKNWTEANTRAYFAILNALDSVRTSADSDEYSKWFQAKATDPGNRQRFREWVIEDYRDMLGAFNGIIRYTKNKDKCGYNKFAWSIRNNSPIINLCGLAFDDSRIQSDFSKSMPLVWGRAFITVHELSHSICNKEDKEYDWDTCAGFAKSDPGQATQNAQNYALFAMKLIPPFGKVISLFADNGRYLSINQDDYLLADKENVREQEKFAVVDAGRYYAALKVVATNRYVTTDAETGKLRACATQLRDAQKFRWLDIDHGMVALGLGGASKDDQGNDKLGKLVSFKVNPNGGSFADPPAAYAIADSATPRETFKFQEVSVSYRRIKVSSGKGSFLGFLDMKDSAYCEAVLQSDANVAHRYKWHQGDKPSIGRLDQRTSPSDRSFTYSGNYPCWGLGDNWVWLLWDENEHTIWQNGNQQHRTLCYNGKDLCFGGPGDSTVKLEFDRDDQGVN